MKLRTKFLISLVAGLLAMALYSSPMWWGVLFSPVTRQLACTQVTEDQEGGFCWQEEGVVLRFKTLDLLLSFFRDR